jgi:hypothetical protein
MLTEILDALAKPIREGALSSLRSGPSGGVVAQLEATVSQYDALRGTRAQPSSSTQTSASATRPKRTPAAYELEIERMCAGDVGERARSEAKRPEAKRPEASASETTARPKSEPQLDAGLVALLDEIDRLDTIGIDRRLAVRPKRGPDPNHAEPGTVEPTEPASTDVEQPAERPAADPSPADRRRLSPADRRRLARARMLRRRRVLALALRRPAKPLDDHPALREPPTCASSPARHAIARGPPG